MNKEIKVNKSGNEEVSFFNTKGRITRWAFFLRLALILILYWSSKLIYQNGIHFYFSPRFNIFFETVHFFVLPIFLCIFLLIQGIKRAHDVDKSGWYFLIPFLNIILIFMPGTRGPNNYGIDPTPRKIVEYFDEIDTMSEIEKNEQSDSGSQIPEFLFWIMVLVVLGLTYYISIKYNKDPSEIGINSMERDASMQSFCSISGTATWFHSFYY